MNNVTQLICRTYTNLNDLSIRFPTRIQGFEGPGIAQRAWGTPYDLEIFKPVLYIYKNYSIIRV